MTKHRPPRSDGQPPAPFTREQELRVVEIVRDILHAVAREEACDRVGDFYYATRKAIELAGFTEVPRRKRDENGF